MPDSDDEALFRFASTPLEGGRAAHPARPAAKKRRVEPRGVSAYLKDKVDRMVKNRAVRKSECVNWSAKSKWADKTKGLPHAHCSMLQAV